MTPATVSVASLRNHVLLLHPFFKKGGAVGLEPLTAEYPRFLRQLTRAAARPDLDSLADAIRTMDQLSAKVETIHRRRPVLGILRIRAAFAGIEEFIDLVPMADPGEEPAPYSELDIPTESRLARLMREHVAAAAATSKRKCFSARAAAPFKRAA